MSFPDRELATKEVGCVSEALRFIYRSTGINFLEYLTTFYRAQPRTVVEDAVQEAALVELPTEDVSELQTPSSHEGQDKIKWGNNDVLPSVPQQVMDPYPYKQCGMAFRLRTVEGLKDGYTITSIPSDGLLLESYPIDAYSNDVNAPSKDDCL